MQIDFNSNLHDKVKHHGRSGHVYVVVRADYPIYWLSMTDDEELTIHLLTGKTFEYHEHPNMIKMFKVKRSEIEIAGS